MVDQNKSYRILIRDSSPPSPHEEVLNSMFGGSYLSRVYIRWMI